MKSDVIVGMDLGTTNSEVCILEGNHPVIVGADDDFLLPSCVGLNGANTVIVGREARNQLVAAPERTICSVKRLMGTDTRITMGEQDYSPQEISAFILKALKERAEHHLGQQVTRAVITVPAYFTDAQRQATRDAGAIAGLEVVRIINEPTAASLSYDEHRSGQQRLLVYDLGGGTFDVSIVAVEDGVVEVLASNGNNRLGGDDFDSVIVSMLNDTIESVLGIGNIRDDVMVQARLKHAAEGAKIDLSTEPYVTIEEDHIGTVDGVAQHLSFELSRHAFEHAIEDMLGGTMQMVNTALNDAGVRPDELNSVLLVGGSTRIPRIPDMLHKRLGHEPHGEIDPDLCVALGAGIQAGLEMGRDMQAILVDVTPYTFGIRCLGELDGLYSSHLFAPIIRRNTRLPATRTRAFFKMHEDQTEIDIDVYQGEDEDTRNNVLIGSFQFGDLEEIDEGDDLSVLVTYNLDLDGILHVKAVERASGREVHGTVENPMAPLADEEVSAARKRIGREWGDVAVETEAQEISAELLGDGERREVERTRTRAKALQGQASEEDEEELSELLHDLQEAIRTGDRNGIIASQRNLDDLLFFLE